jgi:hypothetical protein
LKKRTVWRIQHATMNTASRLWNTPFRNIGLCLAIVLAASSAAGAASLSGALNTIRNVGPEGKGNAAASEAWQKVSAQDGKELVTILKSMNGANDLAVNWLRAAVDAIAAREISAGKTLPLDALQKFLGDTRNDARARRLAFELIARVSPSTGERLLEGMLDDPGKELRHDAVQRKIDQALATRKAGQSNAAATQLMAVLPSARDADQVETIAKQLKQLGQPVDLPKVFGWLWDWKVIGPFDSTGGAGFEKVFSPEEKIDLTAEYDGKNGKVRWQDTQARGDRGLVDFNKPCGALKGVAGYAYTEFYSDKSRPVELRLGCKNAWKVWLNGKYLFGRDEYHRGMEIDQYRLAGELKKGKNTILVKLCQNEQVEEWTKEWEFQLRVTDPLGAPLASAKK